MKNTVFLRYFITLMLIFSLAGAVSAQSEDMEMPEGEPVEYGTLIEGELDDDNPIVGYTLELEEGDGISAYLDDDDYDATYLLILDEDGDIIMENSTDPLFDYAARIFLFVAPEDGTYTLAVTSVDYYFSAESAGFADFIIKVDEVDYETVSFGDVIEGELTEEAPYAVYVLDVERGDLPQIVLESAQSDVLLDSLTDIEVDDREGNKPEATTDSYITPFYAFDDDTFYILVYDSSFEPGDEYTLNVSEYDAFEMADGDSVTIPLTVATISNFVTFEGEEDDVVSLIVEQPENMQVQIAVFDPDGRVIAVEDAADGVQGLELIEDGVYTAQIYPGGFLISLSDLGEVEVSLTIE